MIATPAKVFADEPPLTPSVASEKVEPNNAETVDPEGDAVSSTTAVNVAAPEATGASFTAVTELDSTTVPDEYPDVPPLLDTFTVAASVTATELSISRVVRLGGVPFQLLDGKNRSSALEPSVNALASL